MIKGNPYAVTCTTMKPADGRPQQSLKGGMISDNFNEFAFKAGNALLQGSEASAFG